MNDETQVAGGGEAESVPTAPAEAANMLTGVASEPFPATDTAVVVHSDAPAPAGSTVAGHEGYQGPSSPEPAKPK